MYLSKASYDLCRSINIVYRNYYLIAVNCRSSLASREVVPVLEPSRKPWKLSWKAMEAVKHQLLITVTTFHTTSTRTILR